MVKRKWCAFLYLCTFLYSVSYGHNDYGHPDESTSYRFEENKGQWIADYQYVARWPESIMRFTADGISVTLVDPAQWSDIVAARHERKRLDDSVLQGHNYTVQFLNARKGDIIGEDASPFYTNYLIGDPSRHRSYVRSHKKISYNNIYDKVDLHYYFKGNRLKYDWVVHPGGNPDHILWSYHHVDDVFIAKGELHVCTEVNEVVEQAPYAYQIINGKEVAVACHFSKNDEGIYYTFPDGYQKDLPLIIDPILNFASYSGATDDNWGNTATFDDDGHLYAGSVTFNQDAPNGTPGSFPTTPGAFQTTAPDSGDINMVLSKFAVDGSTLEYATYLGGSDTDYPNSLIVNSRDELVILGTTGSTDYPTTPGAYDQTFNGGNEIATSQLYRFFRGTDIVVTILNADGSNLVGSTYIGGSGNDGFVEFLYPFKNYGDELREEIILDAADNMYIASSTSSLNFPVTTNAPQNAYGGGESDGVVLRLNATATALTYSTYLGGRDNDAAYTIRLDENNKAIVGGITNSSDFPVSGDAFKDVQENYDGFIVRMSPSGNQIERGTFIGTARDDFIFYLDQDTDGNIVAFGQTAATNYNVFNAQFNNPGSANFLQSLDADFIVPQFSTVIGNGNGMEGRLVPAAFLVYVCDQIYISAWYGAVNGEAPQFNYPLSSDALQTTTDGSDFYLMVLEPQAEGLLYGTYFGGDLSADHVDGGTSRFDKAGIVYQSVCASCINEFATQDFPTTAGAFSRMDNGPNCNLGVFKLDFQLAELTVGASAGPVLSDCSPLTVNFINNSVGPATYLWDFDGAAPNSTARTPVITFTQKDTYDIKLFVIPISQCVDPDTVEFEIIVEGGTPPTFVETEKCPLETARFVAPNRNDGSTYQWPDGSTDSVFTTMDTGLFILETIDGNCFQSDSFYVGLKDVELSLVSETDFNGFDISCNGQLDGEILVTPLDGQAPYDVTWENGVKTFSRTNLGAGLYEVTVIDALLCQGTDSIELIEADPVGADVDVTDIGCQRLSDGVISIFPRGGVPPFEYQLDDGPWQDEPIFMIPIEGNYTIRYRDANGCLSDTTVFVNEPLFIEVALTSGLNGDQLLLGDETILTGFTNLNDNFIDTVIWSVQDDINCLTCFERVVSPTGDTWFTFTVRSIENCEATDSIFLRVDRTKNIYFPNIFSPNSDSQNDIFQVLAKDGTVENINYLRIFNRWGDLVYIQRDFLPNIGATGWNGIFNGEPAPPAVYTWVAEVSFIDGVTEVFKGDVTLLR